MDVGDRQYPVLIVVGEPDSLRAFEPNENRRLREALRRATERPGAGATFRIVLPLRAAVARSA